MTRSSCPVIRLKLNVIIDAIISRLEIEIIDPSFVRDAPSVEVRPSRRRGSHVPAGAAPVMTGDEGARPTGGDAVYQ